MLNGLDFIVFSDDWGRHPFSCQHLMKHFLLGNRILWVNTIGMRNPRLSIYDLKRSIEKIKSFRKTSSPIALPQNLTVINPFMLPFGNRFVRKFNHDSVIKSVRVSLEKLNFDGPIVLTTLPNAADYLDAFDERLSVYYCVDEFSEWPGVNAPLVKMMEKELLEKIDCVIAVSDELCRAKLPSNGRPVRFLSHGVDVEHFRGSHELSDDPIVQKIMGRIPSPIIGYFGLFDERSDHVLLEAILKKHPDWSVVVLGKSMVKLDIFLKYNNFYHIEAVSYDQLPAYVSFFSVCILPYVRSILTDNINPLKLKEYLATGKPVISTALPEAVKLQPWVRIASNHEEFLVRIEDALAESVQNLDGLFAFLLHESWKTKSDLVAEWISCALSDNRYICEKW